LSSEKPSDAYEVGEGHVIIPLDEVEKRRRKKLESTGLKWCPKRNRYVAATSEPCKPEPDPRESFEEMEHKSASGKTYRALLSKFPDDHGQRKIMEIYDISKGLLTPLDPQEHELLKQIFESKIAIEENKAKSFVTKMSTPKPAETLGEAQPLRWNAKTKKWE